MPGQRGYRGVEGRLTYPGEADFVPKVVETADTVLCILVVVILDEAEAEKRCQQ